MNSSNPPNDFEYQLAEEEDRRCSNCGKPLSPDGSCPACAQALLTQVAQQQEESGEEYVPPDAELDEYGEPIPASRRNATGWDELMEKQEDGELPASFYAVALAVIVVIGLASLVSESPVTATIWVGALLTVGGLLTLLAAYRWIQQEVEGDLNTILRIPFRAVGQMISPGASEPLPRLPSIDIGKWAVVSLAAGLLSLLLSGLLAAVGLGV